MTVIASVISKEGIVVATDSLISREKTDGDGYAYEEYEKSKICRIENYKAALSYWGIAEVNDIPVLDWIKAESQTLNQSDSLEGWCKSLCELLNSNNALRTQIKNDTSLGLGIHVTGYELVNGYYLPELFLVTNFSDIKNDGCYVGGNTFHCTRRTFHHVSKEGDNNVDMHGGIEYRLKTKEFLDEGRWLIFNNGDCFLFNAVLRSIAEVREIALQRNLIKQTDINSLKCILVNTVGFIGKLQKDFYKSNYKVVGGKIHNLVIEPNGTFSSTSGD